MQNKKKLFIVLFIVILVGLGIFGYLKFNNEEDKYILTKEEKSWINGNKNQLIDMSIINKIPVINYNGNGVFFDYISYVESDTGLEFNKIPYAKGEKPEGNYVLKVTDEPKENDILIYQDEYAIMSTSNIKYDSIYDIDNVTLGVLSEDEDYIKEYLFGKNITYLDYNTVEELLDLTEGANDKNIALVLPKVTYLNYAIEKNLTISYTLNELKINYYLSLGEDEMLNKILTKCYKKWEKGNYEKSFKNHLLDSYFTFSNADKNILSSKRYTYGFIDNAPYDLMNDEDYIGINNELVNGFEDFAEIEFIYKKYPNIKSLVDDFNLSNIDLMFNNIGNVTYDVDTKDSVNIYSSKAVALTHVENDTIFNSIRSLKGQNVLTIKDTKLNELLISEYYNLLTYDNIKGLIKDLKKDDIIIIDYESYLSNIDSFEQFKISFTFDLDEMYGFKYNASNEVFNNLFDFYITFYPTYQFKSNGYLAIFNSKGIFEISKELLISIVIIIALLIIIVLLKLAPAPKKVKSMNLSKGDKLKYIDMLTSLKNRNYLNDNIEFWDSTEVYPQAIVIVDLNNVAYINDNYGHAAGDAVIVEAANVLIKNQMSNTDIIRTNGNEFLIYMVEYDEKQVISYIKKLNKELKEISYGFGAAIGYSMINDAIKTIDDAVNEATIDMRTVKEEIENDKN